MATFDRDWIKDAEEVRESEIEEWANLADGIYGTSKRVKEAANRIREWVINPGDLDIVFGCL